MKIHKRIISSICIIAIIFSAATPAFAEDYNSKTANFWDSFLANVVKNSNLLNMGFLTTLSNGAAANLSQNVCEFSSDGYHHCSSVDSVDTDSNGYILNCTCDDCHQKYVVHSSELPAGYEKHVEEMPVNGVTNTGSFVWYPTVHDINVKDDGTIGNFYIYSTSYYNIPVKLPPFEIDNDKLHLFVFDENRGLGFDVYPPAGATSFGRSFLDLRYGLRNFELVVPSSGTYLQHKDLKSQSSFQFADNAKENERSSYWYTYGEGFHRSGDIVSVNGFESSQYKQKSNFYLCILHGILYFPVYDVTPDISALVGHETDYEPDTRPGDIIQIDNVTIVDETNNYFTDPETKEPQPIENWTYDYSDRSYHVTTNEGDSYVVTYGDEHVTIEHGDTVNEYNYYITNNTQPDPTPVDPDHKHTYTSETVKAAACTEPGSIKYTCSGCGHTYTESVPALGHDWIVSESTEDEYSFPKGVTCPNGAGHALTYTLNKDDRTYHVTCSDCGKEFDVDADVKFGHKVYTCSRCGETYEESNKDSGGLFEAIGDFLADGIRWIVDKLKQLVEAFHGIGEIFTGFVERLEESAGGYPEFFSQIVAIMPEDLMTVIWFAIVAAFAVAAWRKWFG